MAGWPVYSESFLIAQGAAGSWWIYVPSDERWVVKHFALVSHAGAGAGGGLFVAGVQVAYATIQVSGNDVQRPMFVVARPGDRVQINLGSPNMYATACGFRFADNGAAAPLEAKSWTPDTAMPHDWEPDELARA